MKSMNETTTYSSDYGQNALARVFPNQYPTKCPAVNHWYPLASSPWQGTENDPSYSSIKLCQRPSTHQVSTTSKPLAIHGLSKETFKNSRMERPPYPPFLPQSQAWIIPDPLYLCLPNFMTCQGFSFTVTAEFKSFPTPVTEPSSNDLQG